MSLFWVEQLLGGHPPAEGEQVIRNGVTLVNRAGIARDLTVADAKQAQTRDMFAFKWQQRETYSSSSVQSAQIAWIDSRYGGRDLLAHLGGKHDIQPLVLDAGCGSGFSAQLLFKNTFDRIRYVGSDISEAVDIACADIRKLTRKSAFFQCDLMRLPFVPRSFDIVFAEGVLHHTSSTREALFALASMVKQGGILAFYVYNKKAPIREFTDDHIRAQVADLAPQQAWKALEPLTKLGIALGELKTEIEVPEDVPVLGIARGRYDIQRLFYWTICKAYFRPEFSFDEMNHVNFDWFTPKYSHRQTPEEVMTWCSDAGLVIEHIKVEEAGITVVCRRRAAN